MSKPDKVRRSADIGTRPQGMCVQEQSEIDCTDVARKSTPERGSDAMKMLANWKVQLAFGAALVILVVVGAASYRGMVVASESDRWVRHTHEVLENLQELLFAMESNRASARGFTLTGKESYLESYRASILGAERPATVRSLTADNPNSSATASPRKAGSSEDRARREVIGCAGQRFGGGSGCHSKRTGRADKG